ncbi:MAG: LytTR family DNA-binding domain-containing protein, partial [Pseudomonadota bacterium]
RIHLSAQGAAVHRRDTLISDTTLEQFSQRLEAHSFIRVHRSYLVNLNHIASLKTRGRGHEIYLAGVDIAIPVARSRLGALKRAVGIAP